MAEKVDWAAYFRELRAEKDAALKGKAELVAPPPEHTSRDPWPEGFAVPAAPASLVKLAESHGWVARVQYARGSVVTRKRDVGLVVERRHSVAVILWHPASGMHAAAVWESVVDAGKVSWKSSMAKSWRSGEVPAEIGVAWLKDRVRSAGLSAT